MQFSAVVSPNSSNADLLHTIQQGWSELEAFSRGDAQAAGRLHTLLHQSTLGVFQPCPNPDQRSALHTFPPQLLLHMVPTLTHWTAGSGVGVSPPRPVLPSSPTMLLMAAILNAAFVTRIIPPAMAQSMDARPTYLNELQGLYIDIIHPFRRAAVDAGALRITEPIERQLLLCVSVLQLLRCDHSQLVGSMQELFSGTPSPLSCSPCSSSPSSWQERPQETPGAGLDTRTSLLMTVKLWTNVLEVIHDDRIALGTVRRAQHQRALERQMDILLQYADALVAWVQEDGGGAGNPRAPVTVAFAAEVVTKAMHWSASCGVEEAVDCCPNFFTALPQSRLWDWSTRCIAAVTAADTPAPTGGDVETAVAFVCAAMRLCTVIEPNTEALLRSALLLSAHLSSSSSSHSLVGYLYGSRVMSAIMESAARLVVLEDSSPLLPLLSDGAQVVLRLLRADAGSSWEAAEALLAACEGINCLAEVLRPDPIPDMEPSDDPEDFELVVAEMRTVNEEKGRAMERLRGYLTLCQEAIGGRLERWCEANAGAARGSGDGANGLRVIARAIVDEEDLYQIGFDTDVIALWVTYERLYDLLKLLPGVVEGSGPAGGVCRRLLSRLPSRTALIEYFSEQVRADLQHVRAGADRESASLFAVLAAESALLSAAVHRCFGGGSCSGLIGGPAVDHAVIARVAESLMELLFFAWEQCQDVVFCANVACGLHHFARSPGVAACPSVHGLWSLAVERLLDVVCGMSTVSNRPAAEFEAALDVCEVLLFLVDNGAVISPSSAAKVEAAVLSATSGASSSSRRCGSGPSALPLALATLLPPPLSGAIGPEFLLSRLSETMGELEMLVSEDRRNSLLGAVVPRVAQQLGCAFFANGGGGGGGGGIGAPETTAVETLHCGLLQWVEQQCYQQHWSVASCLRSLATALPPGPMRGRWLVDAVAGAFFTANPGVMAGMQRGSGSSASDAVTSAVSNSSLHTLTELVSVDVTTTVMTALAGGEGGSANELAVAVVARYIDVLTGALALLQRERETGRISTTGGGSLTTMSAGAAPLKSSLSRSAEREGGEGEGDVARRLWGVLDAVLRGAFVLYAQLPPRTPMATTAAAAAAAETEVSRRQAWFEMATDGRVALLQPLSTLFLTGVELWRWGWTEVDRAGAGAVQVRDNLAQLGECAATYYHLAAAGGSAVVAPLLVTMASAVDFFDRRGALSRLVA